jgi:ferredoxin-NADP reductase
MAVAKSARVLDVQSVAPDTRLFELEAAEPLGFAGGQYIIIDSGLVLPSGKAVKRAFSILSSDADSARFQLAVKRIAGGPGSGFMHGLTNGSRISFSGPWGKLVVPPAASGETLILATDTGITAALGLVRATRFLPLLERAELVWLRTAADYFLPDDLVRRWVPASCGRLSIDVLPPIGHIERISHVRAILARVAGERRLQQVFIAGDGAVNYALLDDLVTLGLSATRDNVESFFNMPKKSA